MSSIESPGDKRRRAVFAGIRRSLGVRGNENVRKVIVDGRLQNRPTGTIPKRGQLVHFKRIDLFVDMAQAASATVTRVKTKKDILPAVSDYLRAHNLPSQLVHGSDPYLKGLDWKEVKNLDAREGAATGEDLVSLGKAFGAVAESGTLVMLSGADNPVTLNFLPDTSIVVVEGKDIAGDYETVWANLRLAMGDGPMPRTVNWITGPSRTADIEQTLLLGAHGPRSLHVIVVG